MNKRDMRNRIEDIEQELCVERTERRILQERISKHLDNETKDICVNTENIILTYKEMEKAIQNLPINGWNELNNHKTQISEMGKEVDRLTVELDSYEKERGSLEILIGKRKKECKMLRSGIASEENTIKKLKKLLVGLENETDYLYNQLGKKYPNIVEMIVMCVECLTEAISGNHTIPQSTLNENAKKLRKILDDSRK